jgi:hypothetical protein
VIDFNNIKTLSLLALLVALPAAALDFWYIRSTSIDVPFQTSFFFMDNLIKYYNGTLTFKDMTVPYGEHRVLGTNIIFIINAIIFKLNTKIEHWIFFLVYLITDFLIISKFVISGIRTSTIKSSNIFYTLFTIFIFSALCFTLNQHYDTGMGVQVILGLLFSLFYIFTVDYIVTKGISLASGIFLFVEMLPTFLVFGTGYTYDAAFAILLCIAMRCVIRRRIETTDIVIFAVTTLGCILYIKMPFADPLSGTSGLGHRLLAMALSPVKVANFFLVSLGASIIGQRPFSDSLIDVHSYRTLGIFVSVLYLASLVIIYKTRKAVISYVPVLLILYTILNIFIVCLGRWDYMDSTGSWGVGAWYVYHNKLGLIGAVWTICTYLATYPIGAPAKPSRSALYAISTLTISAIILAPEAISEWHVVKAVPFVRQFTEQAEYYAFFPEDTPADSNGVTPFYWQRDELLKYLDVMRDHRIGPYKPRQNGNGEMEKLSTKGDFYPDGWVGKTFSFIIETGPRGELFMTSYAPSSVFPDGNGFRVTMNGKEIYHGYMKADTLSAYMATVPANSRIGIKIIADIALMPSATGLNNDSRYLSFKVGDLFAR